MGILFFQASVQHAKIPRQNSAISNGLMISVL